MTVQLFTRPKTGPRRRGNSAPKSAKDESEAEALRAALGEAVARSARLVSALKNHRRQRKAIESAWTSLQQLKLGG